MKYLVKILYPKNLYPSIKEIIRNNKKFIKNFINCNNNPIAYKNNNSNYILFYNYDEPNLKSFIYNHIKFFYYDYIPDLKIPDLL